MPVSKTKDWKLEAIVKWVPNRVPEQIPCPGCLGRGETGGGFKDCEDPKICTTCWGHKTIMKPGDELCEPPPVPDELMIKLRAVWKEYFSDPT